MLEQQNEWDKKMKVFVYGATGTVGQNIVKGLLANGHEVIAGTRNPSGQPAQEKLTWVFADPSEPQKGIESLASVDAVFLLSPPGLTNQDEILVPWIQKATELKTKKVVLMTAMGVEHAPPEAPLRKMEILLENSGLNWNIIRPNWFNQNFNTFWISGILKDQKIYFPGGKAKASFIDARDISSVATHLLTTTDFNKQAFALTGSEAIDHDTVANLITKVTGKEIQYVDVSPDDFYQGLVSAGLSPDYSKFLVMIAGALKDGYASAISDSVKKITGQNPISFSQYVEDYKKSWM